MRTMAEQKTDVRRMGVQNIRACQENTILGKWQKYSKRFCVRLCRLLETKHQDSKYKKHETSNNFIILYSTTEEGFIQKSRQRCFCSGGRIY